MEKKETKHQTIRQLRKERKDLMTYYYFADESLETIDKYTVSQIYLACGLLISRVFALFDI